MECDSCFNGSRLDSAAYCQTPGQKASTGRLFNVNDVPHRRRDLKDKNLICCFDDAWFCLVKNWIAQVSSVMPIAPHHFKFVVAFADTDAGGVMYHSRYVEWTERARGYWLRNLGTSNQKLLEQHIIFAIHAVHARFLAPARLDDELEIVTTVLKQKGARMQMLHVIQRESTVLAEITVTLACLTTSGKPRRLPQLFTAT
jgi:acyl-CoA thioester hydrolase